MQIHSVGHPDVCFDRCFGPNGNLIWLDALMAIRHTVDVAHDGRKCHVSMAVWHEKWEAVPLSFDFVTERLAGMTAAATAPVEYLISDR